MSAWSARSFAAARHKKSLRKACAPTAPGSVRSAKAQAGSRSPEDSPAHPPKCRSNKTEGTGGGGDEGLESASDHRREVCEQCCSDDQVAGVWNSALTAHA